MPKYVMNKLDCSFQWPHLSTHYIIYLSCRQIDNDSGSLLGLELTWTWVVLVAVSSFLAIGAGLIGMSICFCRRAPHSSDNHIQCEYSPIIVLHVTWHSLIIKLFSIWFQWTMRSIRMAQQSTCTRYIRDRQRQRPHCRETCITLRY